MAAGNSLDKQGAAEGGSLIAYLRQSRGLALSMVIILPLVILYQIGIVQTGSPTRNIAEVWLSEPFVLLGMPAATAINLVVLGCVLYALWRLERSGAVWFSYTGIMLLESLLYALFIYKFLAIAAEIVHRKIETFLIAGGVPWNTLLLSIGAGVYEELFFRLLLVGGGIVALQRLFRWTPLWSAVLTLAVSSLFFAAAHHLGSLGEPFDGFAFTFRTLCGLFLGVLFITRGPGIAVWAHATYNVLVLWHGLRG